MYLYADDSWSDVCYVSYARIGAPHSVVFGGFSSEALKDRLIDGNAKFVITADGGFRKDKVIELKKAVDAAIELSLIHIWRCRR